MRIIAGEYRSRRLHTPKDALTTRPIPDRVKESVFGMLRGHLEGASVLDCFAGTGAFGLEALSRGAARCVFVERDRKVAELLQLNVDTLGCADRAEVVKGDALGPAALTRAPRPVTIAFFDPPYPLVLDPEGWARVSRQFGRVIDLLTNDGFAILRTPWPFRHEEVIHADGRREWRSPLVGLAEGRQRAAGGKGPRADDNEGEKEWIGEGIDAAAIQAESDEALAAWESGRAAGTDHQVIKHDVTLTFENAQGPETHTYASQALHWYMKRRLTSDAGAAG
jgi:16S rRNA G966 N2-methylase RsmD